MGGASFVENIAYHQRIVRAPSAPATNVVPPVIAPSGRVMPSRPASPQYFEARPTSIQVSSRRRTGPDGHKRIVETTRFLYPNGGSSKKLVVQSTYSQLTGRQRFQGAPQCTQR